MKNAQGFSMIEVMVTMAIIAIAVAIAVPSLGPAIKNNRTQEAADRAVSMIETARTMAVASGNCHFIEATKAPGASIRLRRASALDCQATDDVDGFTVNDNEVTFEIRVIRDGTTVGDQLTFRPSGRLDSQNLQVDDDAALIVVKGGGEVSVGIEVLSNGRVCRSKSDDVNTLDPKTQQCDDMPTYNSAFERLPLWSAPAFLSLLGAVFLTRRRRGKRRKAKPTRLRGYLLIEVMISATLLILAFTASITVLADARKQTTYAGNRIAAVFYAQEKANELIANPGDTGGTDTLEGGIFDRSWNVSPSGVDGSSAPVLAANRLELVEVQVVYPFIDGARTYTLQTYRRTR